MANGTWNEYLLLLGKVTKALEQLTEVEKTKTNAVTAGDLAAVEQCMKQEQVASLNLRGLDQKREKLLDQLGMKGVPLRNIMDHCPPEAWEETEQIADALRRQYAVFQAASEVSRNALEINLHNIETIQNRVNGGEIIPPEDAPRKKADFRA